MRLIPMAFIGATLAMPPCSAANGSESTIEHTTHKAVVEEALPAALIRMLQLAQVDASQPMSTPSDPSHELLEQKRDVWLS